MSVRHLEPQNYNPSEILSRTAASIAVKLRKDYTPFGKGQHHVSLPVVKCATNGELRICVPMTDVVNGQVDEGLKLLLGTGGECSESDPMFEIKMIAISACHHYLHNVRQDHS